jgi:tripartite-type tricarboxylate transporter receptor subunit TctC
VPTIAESGVPGYEQDLWFGLLAPAGTPRGIVNRLNREIAGVLSDGETRARWSPLGLEPRPTTPEEFDRLIVAEIALYTRIARAAHITSQ